MPTDQEAQSPHPQLESKKLLASVSTRFFFFCILLLFGKENILFLFLNFLKISDNDGRRGAKDVAK
jgi:hypothetical protein